MGIREELVQLATYYRGEYSEVITAHRSGIRHSVSDSGHSRASSLVIGDAEYPRYFRELNCPPLVLFYYGNCELLKSPLRLGVIGSRHPTKTGLETVNSYLKPALKKLIFNGDIPVIVNGMARGMDLAAARVAMHCHLPLIMYLGSGIDYLYPAEASDVRDYCIKGNGLIISEYPQNAAPLPKHFPFRNRLIAATSSGILLLEAKMPSGSYSTSSWVFLNIYAYFLCFLCLLYTSFIPIILTC